MLFVWFCLEREDMAETLCLLGIMAGAEFIAVYAVYELLDSSWSEETG